MWAVDAATTNDGTTTTTDDDDDDSLPIDDLEDFETWDDDGALDWTRKRERKDTRPTQNAREKREETTARRNAQSAPRG